jgi:hypothetical protein
LTNSASRSPTLSLGALLIALCLAAPAPTDAACQGNSGANPPATAQDSTTGRSGGGQTPVQKLATEVNDPAAPLTSLQIRDILLPEVAGTDGATNALEFQPVLPVGPFDALPFVQLIKVAMPILTTYPEPTPVSGIGDLRLLDLATFKARFGRYGVGFTVVFPTASSTLLGAGKWQAGPAAALVYGKRTNLVVGVVLENPISFAGDSSRADLNELIVTPALTYSMPRGWFAGLGQYSITFDWEDDGAATIPLGLQIGKLVKPWKRPISLSVEAGKYAAWPAGTPDPGWIFGVEITPVFTWHPEGHDRRNSR